MDVEKTLVEMVKINSAGQDKTAIVSYMETVFQEMGMEYDIYGSKSPSIVASNGKDGLVFSGHIDTVPIGKKWSAAQGEIKNGKVFGRGACDMKGGVVAALAAAERLLEMDTSFSVVLTTDEETTMEGAEKLSQIMKGSHCVVCEPTDLKLSTQEKGILRILLRYYGHSCHSARVWEGENAIYKSLNTIEALKSFENDRDGITVNLGKIQGGEKANVVPDAVDLKIDIRYPPRYTVEDVRSLFSFDADEEKTMLQIEPLVLTPPKEFLEIVGETTISYFATEAVKFSKYMPTVILGPGDPSFAHQIDEYIKIKDVERAADIYEQFARVSLP